jgi:hypothetical protein
MLMVTPLLGYGLGFVGSNGAVCPENAQAPRNGTLRREDTFPLANPLRQKTARVLNGAKDAVVGGVCLAFVLFRFN